MLRLVEKRKKCVSRVLECYNLKVKDTMETKNIWSGNIKSERLEAKGVTCCCFPG